MIKHDYFVDRDRYSIAFLIKEHSMSKSDLKQNYDLDWNDTIIFGLPNDDKPSVKSIKEYFDSLIPIIKALKVKTVFVTDGKYFKVLTKSNKAEPHYGSVLKSVYSEDMDVILSINYKQLFYNPKSKVKLDLSINALNGVDLGKGIVHFEEYPEDPTEWLSKLLQYDILTCDIETYGLHLKEADIASISFAWNKHEGIAFLVNDTVKKQLKDFFIKYKGKLIFHNASFDIRNIIYRCFMNSPSDLPGLYNGLDVLTRNVHDTKLIAYLATNSTERNELSLKALALEYAGNYGLLDEEADITKHGTEDLLKYNLMDTLSTWFVFAKYYQTLIEENQLEIYKNLFIPSLKSIILTELVGMPFDMNTVLDTEKELLAIKDKWNRRLQRLDTIKSFNWLLQKEAFIKKNEELKKKYIPIDQFETTINPNSGIQVSKLLYDFIGLEVLSTTDKGNPSTDKDALKEHLNILLTKYEITEDELWKENKQ